MVQGEFRRASLATSMLLTLLSGNAQADEELDMSFIQGGGSIDPKAWTSLNSKYSPGRYLVDLSLNGKYLGKHILDVAREDSEALCFTDTWLSKAGVYISQDYFVTVRDTTRQCYVLAKGEATKVDFDMATQSLALSVPQMGIVTRQEHAEWDYGHAALRMNYTLNSSKSRYSSTTFGSMELKANIGRWVLNSTASGTAGDAGNSATIAMFTARQAMQKLNADLMLGKTSVGDGLLGSTGAYGVTLMRNNSMQLGNLGYSPVFSGIANSSARVTLTQGNNTLYSLVVPPGPFVIKDLQLYSSGEVTMTIAEENGKEHVQVFPLSVIAGQLSPGQHEFSVSAGMPDDSSDMEGPLLSAFYGYGLRNLTLRVGGAVNQHYQGVTGGIVTGLGSMGALSTEGAWATRKYERQPSYSGSKVQLAWSKQLTTTSTGLRLSWSRALTEEFPELSGFNPQAQWEPKQRKRNTRDEWNAGISQQLGGQFTLSLSGWQRSYYHETDRDTGLSGALSTQVKGGNVSLSISQSRSARGDKNWAASLAVSVPFTLFNRRYSSSSIVTAGRGRGLGSSTGISGSLTDNFSWGISGGREADGGMSSLINGNYSGERVALGGMLSNSTSGGTSGSLSLNGALLMVPAARSVMFSRTTSDTVAIVGVKNIPGVRVNSGEVRTDSNGNAVVPLNSFNLNTVTLDAGSLPLESELSTSSQQVVPSSQAVVWMPFEVMKVQRYLLQIRQQDGEFVPGGTWAKAENGTLLGFVAGSGVLMMNVVESPGTITLGTCIIPLGALRETEKLQEVWCKDPGW